VLFLVEGGGRGVGEWGDKLVAAEAAAEQSSSSSSKQCEDRRNADAFLFLGGGRHVAAGVGRRHRLWADDWLEHHLRLGVPMEKQ
jgi:hypothetical protein